MHTARLYTVLLMSMLAGVALAGRWDGDYKPLNTTIYAADAGSGITITVNPTAYLRVTCDKDFNAATGVAQADGGFFCHDATARCALMRSTLGEKFYTQTNNSTNRIAIQAANATEIALCRVHTQN